MTADQKKELGKLLELHSVKAIYYEENTEGGSYHIIRSNEKDELVEDEILGDDL